ncbi:hypothetical protein WIX39_026185 [Variovorax sp. AB1(2024)]|uniref:hypothetical protein n=1 Tax=Variovorax sp. AB1(2024) TaxID=3132214 RepID=UPI0030A49F25
MAAPFTTDQKLGVDLNSTTLATDIASGADRPDAILGTIVQATNGKTYVYAQANASISASTAVCTVNASTFLATASGGAYTSPPVAMVAGDTGWFSKANV